jgi:hypothetical protein
VRLSGRNKEHIADLECHRRPAVELILKQAFDDIDEFFAWMAMPRGRHTGREVNPDLHDLPSGDTQILLHEIGAPDA